MADSLIFCRISLCLGVYSLILSPNLYEDALLSQIMSPFAANRSPATKAYTA